MMRRTPANFRHGARVITTRRCSVGFFQAGQKGTVVANANDGTYSVKFDGGRTHWVADTEMKHIPQRRESVFASIAMAWVRLWRGAR